MVSLWNRCRRDISESHHIVRCARMHAPPAAGLFEKTGLEIDHSRRCVILRVPGYMIYIYNIYILYDGSFPEVNSSSRVQFTTYSTLLLMFMQVLLYDMGEADCTRQRDY